MASVKHNIFIPITKVDSERRMVYGVATAEQPDKQGEICDYETSKPYYEKWSADIEKASDGKSKGNLRVMHTNKVAGTIPQILFNDLEKQIEIGAKVIDDDEWKMVLAGGYTGFSQGGSYARKWKDGEFTRYTSNPCEISLVDNPCLASATFEVVKADGSIELRKFQNLEQNKMSKITDKEVVKSEVVQGWRANDGSFHLTKADAITHNENLEKAKEKSDDDDKAGEKTEADATDGEDGKDKADGEGKDVEKRDFSEEERAKLAESGAAMEDGSFPIQTKEDLKNAIHAYGRAKDKVKAKAHIISRAKALGESASLPEGWDGSEKGSNPYDIKKYLGNEAFDVGCALEALISIQFLCERECMEGEDGSQVEDLMMVIDRLKSFIASEIKENTGENMENAMEMSDSGELAKAGAKISAMNKSHLDMMYKSAKDHMDTMEKCYKAMGSVDESSSDDEGTPSAGGITDNVDGRVNVDTTQKATETDELQKKLEDKASTEALQKMVDTVTQMQKRIDVLEAQPASESKGVRLVLKDHGGEIGNGSVEADMSNILKNNAHESPMVQAQRLIKAIQGQK